MAINFSDLSVMLDAHFRLAPPLDSQYTTASGAVREFGDGVSLGDGTSMAGVRGLENIQVVEKANSFDKVREISMKDWLQKTIKENPNPEAVAGAVQNLLKNGQISYFEQGREFATQLHLDPQTNKLSETPIKREALPPVKPTLRFGQKFLRLFGAFKGEEAEQYNRDLLSYEVKMKALAASKARVPVGAGIVLENDDGKGRILVNGSDMTKALGYATSRAMRSQLSLAKRNQTEQAILLGENPEANLKIDSKLLDTNRFVDLMYPNGKPAGINTMQDHIDARVAKQGSVTYVNFMKDPKSADSLRTGNLYGKLVVSEALYAIMAGEKFNGHSDELTNLQETEAFKSLFSKPGAVVELVAKNQVFDQFANNLENNPIDGIKAQAIENLLDVCLEPHPKLSLAVAAGKNPEMNKAANDKQNDKQNNKQMGKEAPKMKASAPKMG